MTMKPVNGIASRAFRQVKRLADMRQEFDRLNDESLHWMIADMFGNVEIYHADMTARLGNYPEALDTWHIVRQRLADGQPPFPENDDWLPRPHVWQDFCFALFDFVDTRLPLEMNQAIHAAGRAYQEAGGKA